MTLSNWIKCVKQKNSCHKQNYVMMNHLEKNTYFKLITALPHDLNGGDDSDDDV